MNKSITVFFLFFVLTYSVFAGDNIQKIYNQEANAIFQLDSVIAVAGNNKTHIMLIIGGDWCKWCKKLDKFIKEDYRIDSLIKADYQIIHVNYSTENKNPAAMSRLDYPQRFGFPVIVILDETGKRIHTQNTGYLEEGEGYSKEKIIEFLQQWNMNATDASNY